jgi:hypothetical protein
MIAGRQNLFLVLGIHGVPYLLALDLIDDLAHQDVIGCKHIGDLVTPGAGCRIDSHGSRKRLLYPGL